MPTVSVVIPLYNSEKTIQSSIDSVLNQTFSDFELIIINDGSTDQSLDIVKAFQDKRLHILSFQNSGAAAARNRGIANAKGHYIAFLDADDLWTPDKLIDQVSAFKKNPDTGLVYSWSDYIDKNGNSICPGKRVITSDDIEETYGKLLISNFLENGSTPLIPKSILDDVGYFNEALNSSQDLDLYLRIAAKYNFIAVPKVQVYYRITPNSITSKVAENEKKEIEFIDNLFLSVPEKFKKLKSHKLSGLYKYLMLRSIEDGVGILGTFRALRYLSLMVFYRPLILLEQWKFVCVMFLKVIISSCKPKRDSKKLIA